MQPAAPRFSSVALVLLFSGLCLAALVRPAGAESKAAVIQAVSKPWTGDLDGMVKRRFIRVLVAYSKTNYFLDGAQQRGITYDGFKLLEKWLNKRLKLGKGKRVEFVFVPTRRDRLFADLKSGKGDIAAAGLTATEERSQIVDFTEPWYSGVSEIVVTGPAAPPLSTLDDLSGNEVWVRRSSSYYESLTALNQTLTAKGLPPIKIREANENLEGEDILEMVSAGLLPMTVLDDYRAAPWAKVLPDLTLRPDLAVAKDRAIAQAIRKNSPQLKAILDEFILANKNSPEMKHLARVYFMKSDYLKNPAASEDMKRFNEAVVFFQKYGAKYDLDSLLIAAQGYQESRIDQKARSSRGAVGVMQLLPSTASHPPVSIPDISKIDRNIEAGVKYHRYLVDTYFDDPAISPQDRMLLAFAAYNAGPGNVAKMRKMAEKMGYDPNRWFANVEVAAGKVTGQETVRYVSNIFKYFVAYTLITERTQAAEEAKRKAGLKE